MDRNGLFRGLLAHLIDGLDGLLVALKGAGPLLRLGLGVVVGPTVLGVDGHDGEDADHEAGVEGHEVGEDEAGAEDRRDERNEGESDPDTDAPVLGELTGEVLDALRDEDGRYAEGDADGGKQPGGGHQ